MTDAEIFHHEMLRYGGRARLPPDHPAKLGYDKIAKRAEELISSAMALVPNLPHIHFDFVINGVINAWAFKSHGRYFIGLSTGAVFMLELVIMRMLSDSRLFHTIGNPSGELDNLPPLTGFVPDAERMYRAGQRPISPKTSPRLSYAIYLVDHALLFLVGHEIAHITLGHVDYLQSKTGAALVEEMQLHQTGSEALIERQCLEAQADMRSVYSRIASLKLTLSAPNLEQPSWTDSPQRLDKMLFDWAFGMNSLFRLFGDRQFSSSELAMNAYPPLPLRRTMATAVALGCLMADKDYAQRDAAIKALRVAMQYTQFAFATILNEEPSVEALDGAFSPSGQEHVKRITKYMNECLHKRLAPFSYEVHPVILTATPLTGDSHQAT
jgi:hypothetical protein